MYLGKSNMAPELVANASFGFDARFLPLRAAFGGLGIPWRSVAKRGFDIAVSLFLLAVFASWLFPLVALWIRLDSPGPAFFRQRRIGLNGREFELWKFRSMRVHDAPKGICPQATRQDARVTRVGAWLRRFSVDEFPQLFNVLKGEMSLVRAPSARAWHVRRRTALRRRGGILSASASRAAGHDRSGPGAWLAWRDRHGRQAGQPSTV